MAILALAQVPKASVNGALERRPSSFICWNIGDSLRLSRIQIETASRTAESRNGIRQPQAVNTSSPCHVRMPRMIKMAMNRPSVAVVWIQEV
jgi:hypothetical protein